MIRKYNSNNTEKQQLTTCHRRHRLLKNQNKMSTTALKAHTALAPSFEHTNNNNKKTAAVTMSSLAADLCKAAAVQPPPMEAVVVNSIIYSKPSFCSIVVDIGGTETTTTTATTTPGKVVCNKDKIAEQMTNRTQTAWADKPFASEGYFPMAAASTSASDDPDAHVYMMCTTMNGSIHHHISELCDNLIAMGLFGMTNSEHDDDSLIEFAYDDEDELNRTDDDHKQYDDDDDDDDDEDDDDDDDEEDETDDDYDDDCLYASEDVVDFVKSCPIVKAPNEYCDKKKKKVRFNTKPIVHVMHTWNYAYRAARKGDWEMYARDRERFKLRIHRAGSILNPILEREHRLKIYENRFVNLYAEEKEETEKPSNGKPQQPKNTNQKKKQRKKKRRRRKPNF